MRYYLHIREVYTWHAPSYCTIGLLFKFVSMCLSRDYSDCFEEALWPKSDNPRDKIRKLPSWERFSFTSVASL